MGHIEQASEEHHIMNINKSINTMGTKKQYSMNWHMIRADVERRKELDRKEASYNKKAKK